MVLVGSSSAIVLYIAIAEILEVDVTCKLHYSLGLNLNKLSLFLSCFSLYSFPIVEPNPVHKNRVIEEGLEAIGRITN